MMWNKLNAKSVVLLGYTNTYTGTFTTLISCASSMTRNDDRKRHRRRFASSHAAYQAYSDSVLWYYKIVSGVLAVTFLIKYCSLLGSDSDG